MSKFAKEATLELVAKYLEECHGFRPALAALAVDDHMDIVNKGMREGSFANFVGDQVADATEHDCDGQCKLESELDED